MGPVKDINAIEDNTHYKSTEVNVHHRSYRCKPSAKDNDNLKQIQLQPTRIDIILFYCNVNFNQFIIVYHFYLITSVTLLQYNLFYISKSIIHIFFSFLDLTTI